MSRTVEERERLIQKELAEARASWSGPWCSVGQFYVRHIFKEGVLTREVFKAFPAKGGVHYHELPE